MRPVMAPFRRQARPGQHAAYRPFPGLPDEAAGQAAERAEGRGANSGAKPVSSVISDAGTGSVASGSIGGNPFQQRFQKHRRCFLTYAAY